MLAAAWTLALKDLQLFVRDRTAMLLTLLLPLMLVAIFGTIMTFAGVGSRGMPSVALSVLDLDQSEQSRRFVERLSEQPALKLTLLGTEQTDGEESAGGISARPRLEQMVASGDAHHILVIGPKFAAGIGNANTHAMQMYRDPGRPLEQQLVQFAVMQAATTEFGGSMWAAGMDKMLQQRGMQTGQRDTIRHLMETIGTKIADFQTANPLATADADHPKAPEGINPDDSEETREADDDADAEPARNTGIGVTDFLSQVLPIENIDIAPPDRSARVTYQQAQSVAGMAVMMLLFTLTSCASVLLAEREDGMLKRLFALPMPRGAVLLGKAMLVLIVGSLQLLLLYVFGEWLFEVGLFRDPVTLVILAGTWVLTGGAFGMFLAAASQSRKQAEGLATLLILLMAALGGCWFPIQLMNLPPILDLICRSTMTYWAMTGMQGMLWNQLPWYSSKLLTAIGFQAAWAIGFAVLSVFFFDRNYCRD